MSTIPDKIAAYLIDVRGWNPPERADTMSVSLLDDALADSISLVSIVAFLEREFGVAVPDEWLLPENFESISAVARMVTSLRRAP